MTNSGALQKRSTGKHSVLARKRTICGTTRMDGGPAISLTTRLPHRKLKGRKPGLSLASFMLGLPSSANRNLGETEADMRQHNTGWFVQDDIHVTSKLTMNVGLRWDYFQWPYARDNNLSSFDLSNGQWYYPKTNPVTGGPATTSNRSIVNPNYLNFAPRFGLAYRLGDKTTIRTGYGIFYEGNYLWEAQGIRGNWPYAISQTLTDINSNATPVPLQTDLPLAPALRPAATCRPAPSTS